MKKFFVFSLAIAFFLFTTSVMAAVLPEFMTGVPLTSGNYWFVGSTMPSASDSNPSDASTHSYGFPFKTIDKAINSATAQSTTYPGDVIVVLPGHTEDIIAATTLVPDTAGLYIIGLGEGANRPLLAYTATAGSILISGAGTTFDNFIFENQLDNVEECIDVGADDVTIKNCEFRDAAGTSGKIFIMLDGANTADRFRCLDSTFTFLHGTENGDCGIEIDEAQDGIQLVGLKFYGDYDESPLESDAAFTNAYIYDIYAESLVADAFAIEFTGAATGFMDKVLVYTDDMATAIDPGSLYLGTEIFYSSAADSIPVKLFQAGRDVGMGPYVALCTSTSTTSIVDEAFCSFPNDYFNSGWTAYVIYDAGGASSAPQGESSDITDFASATGTFTINAVTSLGAGDKVLIFHDLTKVAVNAVSTPITNSLSDILHKDGSYTFDNTTDSLEAIADAVTTLAGSEGLPYFLLTADSGTTGTVVDATYSGYGDNYFNNGWVAYVVYDAGAAGVAPEGEMHDVTDYTSSTGSFSTGTFSAAIGAGDKVFVFYNPLFADASSGTDLTKEVPDGSVLSNILDDGGDTSGYERAKHSLNAIGTDTDAILADTTQIADGALPAAPTASSLATFIASGGTALGTALADSKSLVDAIGTNGTTVADTATGIAGMIGVNDSDNTMNTSSVAANQDGSVYERLEQLMRMQPQVSEIGNVAMGASQADMWTIAGGYIEVMGIWCFLTTAPDATGTNCKLTWDPTQGTDTDLCANLDIASKAQYSYLYITGDVSDAMVNAVLGTDVAHMFFKEGGLILGPGTIDLTLSADPSATGAWYMAYRVLEPGATVTPFAGD